MRGKKAKRLRRAAEQATVGLPKVTYFARRVRRLNKPTRIIIMMGDCTRKFYKTLKTFAKGKEVSRH